MFYKKKSMVREGATLSKVRYELELIIRVNGAFKQLRFLRWAPLMEL